MVFLNGSKENKELYIYIYLMNLLNRSICCSEDITFGGRSPRRSSLSRSVIVNAVPYYDDKEEWVHKRHLYRNKIRIEIQIKLAPNHITCNFPNSIIVLYFFGLEVYMIREPFEKEKALFIVNPFPSFNEMKKSLNVIVIVDENSSRIWDSTFFHFITMKVNKKFVISIRTK